jgi:Na+/alanine symporter
MAIPNLIAVFLLSGTVVRLIKNYFSGEEYIPYHEQEKMLKKSKQ